MIAAPGFHRVDLNPAILFCLDNDVFLWWAHARSHLGKAAGKLNANWVHDRATLDLSNSPESCTKRLRRSKRLWAREFF